MIAPPPDRPLPDRIGAGIALRIGAACTYAMMAALFKLASQRGVGPVDMLFHRAVFGLPVVLAWVLGGPGLSALGTHRPGAHLVRSALGIVSIMLTFQAFILLPLELSITIGFTAPIFATLLSALLLREAVGPRRWAAVAAGFAGIVVASRPGAAAIPLAGLLVALASALGQGTVTVTLRRLGRTEHPAAIVFWFFAASLVVGALGLPLFGHRPDLPTLGLLAAGGMLGGVMQLMMTASLRLAPVGTLAPFDYSQILWAVLIGWAAFGDMPAAATLAGAALIAGSGLYTAWREHRLHRRASVPVPVE